MNKFIVAMYSTQILFEILAVILSISLISTSFKYLGSGLIIILSGIMFIAALVIGAAMLVSIPNKKNHVYKMNVTTFVFLAFAMICILSSLGMPLLGVIGYTTTFILIPLQIALVLFGHFHWSRRKGIPKFISLFIFITTIFWCTWYLITSLLVPVLLIYIKRPSLESSKQDVLFATRIVNQSLNKEFGRNDDWRKEWNDEPKKSKTHFKMDQRDVDIYEIAPIKDPIKQNDNLVLFAHGLNGTRYTAMRYMEMFYKYIKEPNTNRGYKMLSFDMRGFGSNRDLERTYALKEGDDLNNAFKAIIRDYKPKHLVIYGISNGAASTVSFATKWQKTIINSKTDVKLIEESGYTSARDELRAMTEQFGIPHQITMPQAFPLYRQITKTFWGSRSYIDDVNKVEQPLMIIHGGKDIIVPFDMGQRYLEKRNKGQYKDRTSSLFIEEAGHVKVGREFLKEFIDGVNKFLKKNK
ncbi:hypothetical protein MYMA111404_01520 [Mycoplasma marinum]